MYRGKRLDTGEWVYGYLVKRMEWLTPRMDEERTYICFTSETENCKWFNEEHRVDPDTVGIERNSYIQDAYDGDIICYKSSGFTKIVDGCLWCSSIDLDHKWEVIGNIHDNPELIGSTYDTEIFYKKQS